MSRSITKNLMYNLLLQVVTLVLPLITVPYISRVLGAEVIGTYSFTLSITQYFILFGTLGLSIYGNRQIAYTRDNKEKLSQTFWSLLFLRIVTTGISTFLFIIIFSKTESIYRVIFLIQSLNIVGAMIDISWFYMGLEDFKKTVTRNLAVKIIGVCLIFSLIKSPSDINLYVTINGLMVVLGNAVMWIYLPRNVQKVKIHIRDCMDHLVPSIKLFIPQIAVQVYVVLDKTLIGVLSDVTQVGYFDQAEKIVKVVLALVTSLGVVMLPRMSYLFAKGEKESMNKYLNFSLKAVAYVSVPMSFGIAGVSFEFVPWFFGAEFDSVALMMVMLSPILFFISMSNVMGVQYLLPANRTNAFTASVTFGAAINLLLNLVLIPEYKAYGACIATIIAEFSVTAVQYYCLRVEIRLKEYLQALIKYLIAASIMLAAVRTIGNFMGVGITTTLVQCSVGMIVYILILTIIKENMNNLFFSTIFKKSPSKKS